MVYDLLMCHVSSENIPCASANFYKRVGMTVKDIPHRTTVEQMAWELGVIEDLQAAELLISTPHLTLAFDATTQEGVHMNAIHVTTTSECCALAVDQLPGGTSEDYSNHIQDTIENLSNAYADFHNDNATEVKAKMINPITPI